MPVCKKCNKNFRVRVLIDGKERRLTNRKYCLDCSPFGKHNTARIHLENPQNCICIICNREYIYDRKKGHTRTKCNSCSVNERRFLIKTKAINYKGGKCSICNYNKCEDALVFHHIDPNVKEFAISGNHSKNWGNIQKELDKCILLCCRCHIELHSKK